MTTKKLATKQSKKSHNNQLKPTPVRKKKSPPLITQKQSRSLPLLKSNKKVPSVLLKDKRLLQESPTTSTFNTPDPPKRPKG